MRGKHAQLIQAERTKVTYRVNITAVALDVPQNDADEFIERKVATAVSPKEGMSGYFSRIGIS